MSPMVYCFDFFRAPRRAPPSGPPFWRRRKKMAATSAQTCMITLFRCSFGRRSDSDIYFTIWNHDHPVLRTKVTTLSQDEVLTSGRAQSTLNEHHIKRTRYASVAEWLRAWNTLTMFEATACGRSWVRFSSDPGHWYGFLIWTCLSFQILNLFRTLSSWGSGNYRPSAPFLYEVASHVKNCHSGHYKKKSLCPPYQVSLVLLNMLKQNAYVEYCNNDVMGPRESYSMWNQRSQTVPQIKFWSMIIELELLVTRFVRSLREGDFQLYVQSCDELSSWFHALDHTNYAHWLPVHVRDMMVQLAQRNPEVHAEFMKGNVVVQKYRRKFSLMAKDEAHEQSNKILQTKGGAAGLYENRERSERIYHLSWR